MAGAPRSMWKGAVSFGLVTVPVKLYNATESDYAVRFNMLHKDDFSRINQKIWCPVEEKIIERSETVKGYEYSPDQYVVITEQDLETIPLKTVKSITVEQFVPRDDETVAGQLRFAKQAYYLEPEKVGRKAFYLLREALRQKQSIAICKIVLREREVMAALEPHEDTMLLTTLHWPDEIRSAGWIEASPEDLVFKPAEMTMALQLVDAMSGSFDPTAYRDEYREALLSMVQAKVDGTTLAPVSAPETSAPLDLMEMLKASIEQAPVVEKKTVKKTKRAAVA
jgi:DNA end-binding protein Ku